MTNFELAVRVFLQLAVILVTCRVIGILARKLDQPQVVSEMIAGVVLGPSLVGLLLPDWHSRFFTVASMTVIFAISQIGLVLYMFLVGLEFQVVLVQRQLRTVASVSVAGILTPFMLGAGIAALLFGSDQFFTPGVKLWEAMLFLGAAISITAFPMLARIIYERGLAGTPLGTLALAAGAMDDAAAWCILAVVLASFNNNPSIALFTIVGGAVYALSVLWIGRRLFRRLVERVKRDHGVSHGLLAFVLTLVMLGAWVTDQIGIYAVFGAFILGAAMPRGLLASELQRQLAPLVTTFLLPLFFVYSGLNTRIGLLVSPRLWGVTIYSHHQSARTRSESVGTVLL